MNNDESLAGIRAFAAVGEHGSFTLAARALRVSRTAVSKAIERMEARLQVRLLERSTRHLALTEEGQRFLAHCREVMAALARAEASVAARPRRLAGQVRLSVPPMLGRRWVLPVLATLAERHEGLTFDVSFASRGSELVEEGVDLAVRVGTLPDRAELVARRLGAQPTVLCASRAYLTRRLAPSTPADLTGHRCLTDNRRGSWQMEKGGASAEQGDIPVNAVMCLHDTGALFDAVAGGMGIAQLPLWLVEESLQTGLLQRVMPDHRAATLPIHAVWPRGRHMAPRVRCVIDTLAAAFARHPQFAMP
ncbi:LysR family transcriptional regulator [Bordetella sp. N]|uniref:LysR family transcriptional regulator n=1 Tax=Bordetella sp. N TaxID=1746199 RepID=UPI00070984B0|nr:LysR family transcriptional regulator [Bordetella sp. N]ALM82391.1 hypothetical protein ASB57_04920 [Bordetella sp. N]